MALDQYLRAIPDAEAPDGTENLHYWRKHPGLHGWMEARWLENEQCEPEADFNCTRFYLDAALLDEWERVAAAQCYPETTGFFFGGMRTDDEDFLDDLQAISKARNALADGKRVFYYSWY